jgi:hypothetical protein
MVFTFSERETDLFFNDTVDLKLNLCNEMHIINKLNTYYVFKEMETTTTARENRAITPRAWEFSWWCRCTSYQMTLIQNLRSIKSLCCAFIISTSSSLFLGSFERNREIIKKLHCLRNMYVVVVLFEISLETQRNC